MRTLILSVSLAGLTALVGCGHPRTLGPDHGESFHAAFDAQTDLTRASAVDDQYELSGMEAMEIRMRVQEAATDEADTTPEATQNLSNE